MCKRFVDERSCQPLVLSAIITGFNYLRYHDICLAGSDQSRDLLIDIVYDQRHVRKVFAGKLFIESARIDHDAHLRPVDRLKACIFICVLRAAQNGLAVFKVAVGHQRLLFPGIGNGDAADRKVKFACQCVIHQRRPGCFHVLNVDAQSIRQILSQFRVETDITACFRIKVRHRLIIPCRTDFNNAPVLYFLKLCLGLLLTSGRKQHADRHDNDQQCAQYSVFFHFVHTSLALFLYFG